MAAQGAHVERHADVRTETARLLDL